jgi:hypothetical protein
LQRDILAYLTRVSVTMKKLDNVDPTYIIVKSS